MSAEKDVLKIRKKLEKMIRKKTTDQIAAVIRLKALQDISISLEVLRKTRIGMTVNNFRKSTTSEEVTALCKNLIKNWKKLLPDRSRSKSYKESDESKKNVSERRKQKEKSAKVKSKLTKEGERKDADKTTLTSANNTVKHKSRELHADALKTEGLSRPMSDRESHEREKKISEKRKRKERPKKVQFKLTKEEKRKYPDESTVRSGDSSVRIKCPELLVDASKGEDPSRSKSDRESNDSKKKSSEKRKRSEESEKVNNKLTKVENRKNADKTTATSGDNSVKLKCPELHVDASKREDPSRSKSDRESNDSKKKTSEKRKLREESEKVNSKLTKVENRKNTDKTSATSGDNSVRLKCQELLVGASKREDPSRSKSDRESNDSKKKTSEKRKRSEGSEKVNSKLTKMENTDKTTETFDDNSVKLKCPELHVDASKTEDADSSRSKSDMESDERLKKVSKIKESSGKATKKLGKRKDADEAIATADNITVRLKCRELLEDALKTDDASFNDPSSLAQQIEEHIFEEFKSTDSKYKSRVRSRVANLKDLRHPALKEKVLQGQISPGHFARMTAEEMASEDMKDLRAKYTQEAINEHQMAKVEGVCSDLFSCEKCGGNNCTYNQVQLLCSDEPMTTFLLCFTCGNRWSFC